MSFFTTSNGETIEAQSSVETSGIQDIIPDGTKLECHVIEAKWMPEDNHNNEHILIRLHVTQPGKYRDFLLNHKLHVKDDNPKKSDRSRSFLAAYDGFGKGLLKAADKEGRAFSDALLSRALVGVGLIATVAVWTRTNESTGEDVPAGNWVRGISQLSKKVQEAHKRIEEKAKSQPESADFDDDIPF